MDNLTNNFIYGIPKQDLSYRQFKFATMFAVKVEPWLNENIGVFNVDWFVEADKSADSLRLQFKDDSTETYFKLAWMARDHDTA